MDNLLTYWVTWGQVRKISTRRRNEIYVGCYKLGKSIEDLYNETGLQDALGLSEEEKDAIEQSKQELSNNAFHVENLQNQGYSIIPLDSSEYPKTLKVNLKVYSPSVIYAKGNLGLLQEASIAIVGSRKASDLSLAFAADIAKQAAEEGKVVVSGGAKGVDLEALNSVVDNGGKSIIVLPQGITTYSAGYRQYYKPILEGRLLVISEFAPMAGWSVGLAMARNTTIYGLADEIYVAESDNKGGTWEGVTAGLKMQRKIFVRLPNIKEKNANNLLIAMGAKPLNYTTSTTSQGNECDNPLYDLASKVKECLMSGGMTSAELLERLKIEMGDSQMRQFLDSLDFAEKYKQKNKNYYRLKGTEEKNLFDDWN